MPLFDQPYLSTRLSLQGLKRPRHVFRRTITTGLLSHESMLVIIACLFVRVYCFVHITPFRFSFGIVETGSWKTADGTVGAAAGALVNSIF